MQRVALELSGRERGLPQFAEAVVGDPADDQQNASDFHVTRHLTKHDGANDNGDRGE